MARNQLRPMVRLRSTVGTGHTHVTRKNRRNDPDRLRLSARAIKTIDKIGIEAAVARIRARGEKI
jgi:large subunit ribosomal protein L33